MRKRLVLLVCTAAVLAAADLSLKALVATEPWAFHARSHAWAALSATVLLASIALALLPSRLVAAASGVLAGGTLANLVSAARDDGRVPNPLVVADVAFNPADVFVLVGIVLQTAALVALAIRHRERLPQSTVAVRLVRRLRRR
jgi:hypothetical protein